MKEKKILYIDMDGVIVDVWKIINKYKNLPNFDYTPYETNLEALPGIFIESPPVEGAIDALHKLHESGKYDMFILSTTPWNERMSSSQKRHWIDHYLIDDIFYKKVIFTHRKDLLMGDYLIDDRKKNGAGEFKGELLSFGMNTDDGSINEYPDWNSILKKLL